MRQLRTGCGLMSGAGGGAQGGEGPHLSFSRALGRRVQMQICFPQGSQPGVKTPSAPVHSDSRSGTAPPPPPPSFEHV